MTDKSSADYGFILAKAQAYCNYQERCISEVKNKLREWNVKPDVADKIISQLMEEDLINEERFVRIFAGSKFRIKKWGKNKIIHELSKRQIPDLIIQIGLQEIDEEEYINTLKEILTRKSYLLRENDPRKHKLKLANYAISRGYRPELVWNAINGRL